MLQTKFLSHPSYFDLSRGVVHLASACGLLISLMLCTPARAFDLPPVDGPTPHQIYISGVRHLDRGGGHRHHGQDGEHREGAGCGPLGALGLSLRVWQRDHGFTPVMSNESN